MLLQRVLLFTALIGLAVSAELFSRKKRSSEEEEEGGHSVSVPLYGPFWPLTAAYAGINGAYAGAGDWFPFPFSLSGSSFPLVPVIQWKPYIPWYKGPNVCKETTEFNSADITKLFSYLGDSSGNSKSESCRETREGRKCITRVGDRMYGTLETCCQGFVRSPDSPGCVKGDDSVPKNPAPYIISQDSVSSSSSYNWYGNGDGNI